MKTEKILSLLITALIPAPLLLTALAGEYGAVITPYMPIWLLLGLSAMALGTLTGRWTAKAKGKMIYPAKSFAVFTGILCTVIGIAAVHACGMNSLTYIFLPLAVYFWYFFGYKNGQGRVLLNNISIGGYCVEAALMFPLCDSACEDSFVLLIISAFVMVMSMVVINSRQLERLSVKKKNDSTVISGTARRYNLKLTLTFASFVLIPFFFAKWGAKWLWELVKIIVNFLLSLFSLSFENIDIGEGFGNSAAPSISLENDTLWFQIIAAVLITAALILAVKPFIKAVKNLIRIIGTALGKKADSEPEEIFYTDFYEESQRKKSENTGFKKAYRDFLREKEPGGRYRLGYKAFMIRLGEIGTEPSPSDTTSAHRMMSRETGASELADIVIDKYEKVRYKDEEVKMGDCEIMEKMLKEVK